MAGEHLMICNQIYHLYSCSRLDHQNYFSNKNVFLLCVHHSNKSCGSMHEDCLALQVVQVIKMLPWYKSLHWPELTPEVVL